MVATCNKRQKNSGEDSGTAGATNNMIMHTNTHCENTPSASNVHQCEKCRKLAAQSKIKQRMNEPPLNTNLNSSLDMGTGRPSLAETQCRSLLWVLRLPLSPFRGYMESY